MKKQVLLIALCLFSITTVCAQGTNLTIHIEAGSLRDSLTQEQIKTVTGLTLTGSMNNDDLYLIQNSMHKLKYLDIKNVALDTIPNKTFYGNQRLYEIILPLEIKYLEDSAFYESGIAISITGKFPQLGNRASTTTGYISITSDNEFCKIQDDIIYSMDGKIMYHSNWPNNPDETLSRTILEGTAVIASRAFDVARIRRLTLPTSLKKIEKHAFANTRLLAYVGYHDEGPACLTFNSVNPPVLEEDVFTENSIFSDFFIWVPKGSRELYKQADPQWLVFAAIAEEGEPEPSYGNISSTSKSQLSIVKGAEYFILNSEKPMIRFDVFNSLGVLISSGKCNDTQRQIPFSAEPGINSIKVWYEDQTFEVIKVMN